MSTSPQGNAPRTIYLNLEQEPEVTQDVSFFAIPFAFDPKVVFQGIAIGNVRGCRTQSRLLIGAHFFYSSRISLFVSITSSH